jgi:hypothetical protein
MNLYIKWTQSICKFELGLNFPQIFSGAVEVADIDAVQSAHSVFAIASLCQRRQNPAEVRLESLQFRLTAVLPLGRCEDGVLVGRQILFEGCEGLRALLLGVPRRHFEVHQRSVISVVRADGEVRPHIDRALSVAQQPFELRKDHLRNRCVEPSRLFVFPRFWRSRPTFVRRSAFAVFGRLLLNGLPKRVRLRLFASRRFVFGFVDRPVCDGFVVVLERRRQNGWKSGSRRRGWGLLRLELGLSLLRPFDGFPDQPFFIIVMFPHISLNPTI